MAEDNPVPPPEGYLMQVVKPDFLAVFLVGFPGGVIFLRIFHPMSRRCLSKVLIINKLVNGALLLGMS